MSHFEVGLLGRWRLLGSGSPIHMCLREQRVVTLIALHGALSRRRIAGILWPETTESRALDSLRVSLYHIHRLAPGLVSCEGGWVELCAQVEVDLHRLHRDLQLWAQCPDTLLQHLPRLIESEELLPDWDELWLAEQQELLRQLRAQVLEAAALEMLEQDLSRPALDLARAAVRLEPMNERMASILARAEAEQGHRALAAAGLIRFIDRLRDDLGISPGPEVTRTLAELREM